MAPDPAEFRDPITFAKLLWPTVEFYDKQREIIYSVQDNVETVVPAGNMLGLCSPLPLWFAAVVGGSNKEKTSSVPSSSCGSS